LPACRLTSIPCQGNLDKVAKSKRWVENGDFVSAVCRLVRAAGVRVGDGDVEDLAALLQIRQALDGAIDDAVEGLRQTGATWEDIGKATGTSRQAAFQKWGTLR
jgi:hypothetical protein